MVGLGELPSKSCAHIVVQWLELFFRNIHYCLAGRCTAGAARVNQTYSITVTFEALAC